MPWGTFELLVEGATAGAPVRGAGRWRAIYWFCLRNISSFFFLKFPRELSSRKSLLTVTLGAKDAYFFPFSPPFPVSVL